VSATGWLTAEPDAAAMTLAAAGMRRRDG